MNAGTIEGPLGDATCRDGVDNNCNGLIDSADEGCQYSGVANAAASSYGTSSLTTSGSFNALALLLIPTGAVILLRVWRRKR